MSKWSNIYTKSISKVGGFEEYYQSKLISKKILIDTITSEYGGTKPIAEIGSGTAILPIYFSKKGYDSWGIEADFEMYTLSREFAEKIESTNIKLINDNFLELELPEKSLKLIYSNGLLEHFDDEKIKFLVQKQLMVADRAIISVPTDYFMSSQAVYGDERFLPIKYWEQLITLSGGNILYKRYFEYNNHFLKILNNITQGRLRFNPPFVIFIVSKNS